MWETLLQWIVGGVGVGAGGGTFYAVVKTLLSFFLNKRAQDFKRANEIEDKLGGRVTALEALLQSNQTKHDEELKISRDNYEKQLVLNAELRGQIGELKGEIRGLKRLVVQLGGDTHTAVIVANSLRQIVHWSPSASIMFGWSAEEMIGELIDRLVPDRFLEAHKNGFEASLGKPDIPGQPAVAVTRESTARTKNGDEIDVTITIQRWGPIGDRYFTSTIKQRGVKAL